MSKESDNQLIDNLLKGLGTGRFQIKCFVFVCLAIMLVTFSGTNFIFTTRDVPYRCAVPECESNPQKYDEPWLKQAIPFKDGLLDKCHRYSAGNNSKCESFDSALEPCASWVFGEGETIVKGLNIPCEDWKRSLVGTVNMIGQAVSLLFSGYLSDRYGRRNVMAIMGASAGVLGFAQSLSQNYWTFLALEFLNLAASDGAFMVAYIYGVELLSADKRVIGCAIIDVSGTIAVILVSVIAWLTQSWRAQIRATNLPSLLLLLTFFVIPESLRWLFMKKKYDKCSKILQNAAKLNNVSLSETDIKKLENMSASEQYKLLSYESEIGSDESTKKSSFLDMLKSPKLSFRLLICTFCWFTSGMVFYGLSINSVGFSGNEDNPYWNFIVVSSAEIPSTFLYIAILKFVGRRHALQSNLIASGFICIVYAVVPNIDGWTALLLFWLGKLFISIAFSIVYIITSELFPTNLRNSAMNFCSIIARVGAGLAPQILLLYKIHNMLPLLTYGAMAVLCGIVVLKLPETRNRTLPNTIKEAEDI